jgi:hypothetical protein
MAVRADTQVRPYLAPIAGVRLRRTCPPSHSDRSRLVGRRGVEEGGEVAP